LFPFVHGILRQDWQSIMQSVIVFSLTVRRLGLSRVAFHQTVPPDAFAGREHLLTEARSRPFLQPGWRYFYSFNINWL